MSIALEKQKLASTYAAHRERQRRRILDAARTLFDRHGIDRVTMAEITSESGLRASTMYQYFANKDDVVWTIAREVMSADLEQVKPGVEEAPNALGRITYLLNFMAEQLLTRPRDVRFMAQFDAMYAREGPTERLLALESQLNPDGFEAFSKLIREGIKDGSLRADLDPELTMHAVINAVIGAQRRLASLGNKVEVEYGQPVDRLFRETVRLILLGLGAPERDSSRPRKAAKKKRRTS